MVSIYLPIYLSVAQILFRQPGNCSTQLQHANCLSSTSTISESKQVITRTNGNRGLLLCNSGSCFVACAFQHDEICELSKDFQNAQKKDLFALGPVSATTFQATCYGCITDHESSACAQRGHVARKISTHLELSRPGDTSTTSMHHETQLPVLQTPVQTPVPRMC